MEFQIKEEPQDFDEPPQNSQISFIDIQYNAERYYIDNFSNLFLDNEDRSLIDSMDISIDYNLKDLIHKRNDFSISDALNSIQTNDTKSKTINKSMKPNESKLKTVKQKQEQIALEKKKILVSLIESAKEKKLDRLLDTNFHYEPLNSSEENKILDKLKSILDTDSLSPTKLYTYHRFKSKLKLRRLKRTKHLQLFDIDSYVNELIDSEKSSEKTAEEFNQANDDIIFVSETLKTNIDKNEPNSGCEIIAITRVLDRFKSSHKKIKYDNYLNKFPIGIVESRNDDVKCLLSPLTNKILKPYVRRDNITKPLKFSLNFQITKQNIETNRFSIDYVHLRPEHVIQINMMCEKFFWSGIDTSDCLNYPDYTLVALYRKLIIGFAFLVPNLTHKESYLSFIFVHPDWRCNSKEDGNVSIAQYMLFYLIQKNNDFDLTLHVACNSPAVIFYQKFGFKIEEFIKNFYDKYYSDSQNLSKDAFFMRLSRQ